MSHNLFRPTNFLLHVPNFPNIQLQVQRVVFPSVYLNEVPVPYSNVDLKVPGDKISYDPIQVTFLVEEDQKSWLEIYDWMSQCSVLFPEAEEDFRSLDEAGKILSDIAISVLTNNSTPLKTYTLFNSFPSFLSGFDGDTTSAESKVTASVTFSFSHMQVKNA